MLVGGDRGTILLDGPAVDLAEQKRSELRGILQGLAGFGSSERTAVGDDLFARCTANQSLDEMVYGADDLIGAALEIPVVDEDDGRRDEFVGLEIRYFLGVGNDVIPFGGLWF